MSRPSARAHPRHEPSTPRQEEEDPPAASPAQRGAPATPAVRPFPGSSGDQPSHHHTSTTSTDSISQNSPAKHESAPRALLVGARGVHAARQTQTPAHALEHLHQLLALG